MRPSTLYHDGNAYIKESGIETFIGRIRQIDVGYKTCEGCRAPFHIVRVLIFLDNKDSSFRRSTFHEQIGHSTESSIRSYIAGLYDVSKDIITTTNIR